MEKKKTKLESAQESVFDNLPSLFFSKKDGTFYFVLQH